MRSTVTAAALSLALALPLAAQARSTTHEQSRIAGYSVNASWTYDDGPPAPSSTSSRPRTMRPAPRARPRTPSSPWPSAATTSLPATSSSIGVAYAFTADEFTAHRRPAAEHRHPAREEDDLPGRQHLHLLQRRRGRHLDGHRRGHDDEAAVPREGAGDALHAQVQRSSATPPPRAASSARTPSGCRSPPTSGQLQFNRFGSVSVTTTTP